MKILFAAKDAAMCTLFGLLLRDAGHEVVVAQSVPVALQLLERGGVEICIADAEFPQLDSFELVAEMRADVRLRGLPVLLLVSKAQAEERSGKCYGSGADIFITKPVNPQLFLSYVSMLADKRGRHKRNKA